MDSSTLLECIGPVISGLKYLDSSGIWHTDMHAHTMYVCTHTHFTFSII